MKNLFSVGFIVYILLSYSGSAHSAVFVCNYSSHNVDIAFVFDNPLQRGTWVSAGWKSANSGQCVNIINYDVRNLNPNIYYYAISNEGRNYGWAGQQQFCLKRGQPFTIYNADRNCTGGEWQGFRWHNVHSNTENYTINIHD